MSQLLIAPSSVFFTLHSFFTIQFYFRNQSTIFLSFSTLQNLGTKVYSIDNVKCKHDRLFLSLHPPQKSIIMMWAWTETFQANYLESKHCNCKIVVVEVVILQQIVTDQVPEALVLGRYYSLDRPIFSIISCCQLV